MSITTHTIKSTFGLIYGERGCSKKIKLSKKKDFNMLIGTRGSTPDESIKRALHTFYEALFAQEIVSRAAFAEKLSIRAHE